MRTSSFVTAWGLKPRRTDDGLPSGVQLFLTFCRALMAMDTWSCTWPIRLSLAPTERHPTKWDASGPYGASRYSLKLLRLLRMQLNPT